jgi:hypothetical protein
VIKYQTKDQSGVLINIEKTANEVINVNIPNIFQREQLSPLEKA